MRLFELGARNLVFLSRSGATSRAAADLTEVLRCAGVTVRTIQCDVADTSQLEAAVLEINQHSPPIKGMLHLGMVMRSALFEKMSLEDWNESFSPKCMAHGTCITFYRKISTSSYSSPVLLVSLAMLLRQPIQLLLLFRIPFQPIEMQLVYQ
jgi:short-subunit dehydrogenase